MKSVLQYGKEKLKIAKEKNENLFPFIRKISNKKEIELTIEKQKEIKINLPNINEKFMLELSKVFSPAKFTSDDQQRLSHSFGKTYLDILEAKKGNIKNIPDLIIYPESNEDIEVILALSQNYEIALYPYGTGYHMDMEKLNFKDSSSKNKMLICINTTKMNKIISLDKINKTITIQSGMIGQKLEDILNQDGFSIGYKSIFFKNSTIGGLISSKSHHILNNDILDLKIVTPKGTYKLNQTAKSEDELKLKKLLNGSKGSFGIISEITLSLQEIDKKEHFYSFIFQNFEDGLKAIENYMKLGLKPCYINLKDANSTKFLFDLVNPNNKIQSFLQNKALNALQLTKFKNPCLLIISFKQNDLNLKELKTRINTLKSTIKLHGLPTGKFIAKMIYKKSLDTAKLREFLLNFNIIYEKFEMHLNLNQIQETYKEKVSLTNEYFKNKNNNQFYLGSELFYLNNEEYLLNFNISTKEPANEEKAEYRSLEKIFIHENIDQEINSLSSYLKNIVDPNYILNITQNTIKKESKAQNTIKKESKSVKTEKVTKITKSKKTKNIELEN
jgi:alkyldihydroxyacetonephosphate synthase